MKKFITILTPLLFFLSILIWIIPKYFPGLLFYIIFYPWIVIPISLIFIITLTTTIRNWILKGFMKVRLAIITHGLVIFLIVILSLINSELFKSEIVLKASLIDDLSRIDLVLRKNNKFEMTSTGMFFYQEKKTGKYSIDNDTLTFSVNPYSNDFIPKRVLYLPDTNRIYFVKKENGEIDTRDIFASYFEIEFNNLKGK